MGKESFNTRIKKDIHKFKELELEVINQMVSDSEILSDKDNDNDDDIYNDDGINDMVLGDNETLNGLPQIKAMHHSLKMKNNDNNNGNNDILPLSMNMISEDNDDDKDNECLYDDIQISPKFETVGNTKTLDVTPEKEELLDDKDNDDN